MPRACMRGYAKAFQIYLKIFLNVFEEPEPSNSHDTYILPPQSSPCLFSAPPLSFFVNMTSILVKLCKICDVKYVNVECATFNEGSSGIAQLWRLY